MKLAYFGRVNNGQLHIIHRKEFDRELYILDGKDVEIIIRRKRKIRSLSQNAYYHAVVCGMIQQRLIELWGEKGITKEQVHELLKRECHKIEITDKNSGNIITLSGSTTEMTTVEFMEYIEKCRQWAFQNLDIDIPEPNEQVMMNFEDEKN